MARRSRSTVTSSQLAGFNRATRCLRSSRGMWDCHRSAAPQPQAGLTITANNQSKEYGNVFTFGGTEFTSAALLNGDVINSVSLSSAGTLATAGVAGSPYVITAANATGSGLGNYTISYVAGSLNVTPAPLSLRASNQSKIYGSTFTFNGTEFSATGLKNNETV